MKSMVWDPFIRVFHWSLVGFFSLAYLLEGTRLALHSHAGYTIGLLLIFRLLWGVVGPIHARFTDFVTSPAQALRYFTTLLRGNPAASVGHDPAGAVMILSLMVSLLVTVISGMSLFAMEGRGPLAGTFVIEFSAGAVETVHSFAADTTLALIAVHVTGVIASSLLRKENLLLAMLTGRKAQKVEAP